MIVLIKNVHYCFFNLMSSFLSTTLCDSPKPWEIGTQDPATPIMEFFHNYKMVFIIFIGIAVCFLINIVIRQFNDEINIISQKFNHIKFSSKNEKFDIVNTKIWRFLIAIFILTLSWGTAMYSYGFLVGNLLIQVSFCTFLFIFFCNFRNYAKEGSILQLLNISGLFFIFYSIFYGAVGLLSCLFFLYIQSTIPVEKITQFSFNKTFFITFIVCFCIYWDLKKDTVILIFKSTLSFFQENFKVQKIKKENTLFEYLFFFLIISFTVSFILKNEEGIIPLLTNYEAYSLGYLTEVGEYVVGNTHTIDVTINKICISTKTLDLVMLLCGWFSWGVFRHIVIDISLSHLKNTYTKITLFNIYLLVLIIPFCGLDIYCHFIDNKDVLFETSELGRELGKNFEFSIFFKLKIMLLLIFEVVTTFLLIFSTNQLGVKVIGFLLSIIIVKAGHGSITDITILFFILLGNPGDLAQFSESFSSFVFCGPKARPGWFLTKDCPIIPGLPVLRDGEYHTYLSIEKAYLEDREKFLNRSTTSLFFSKDPAEVLAGWHKWKCDCSLRTLNNLDASLYPRSYDDWSTPKGVVKHGIIPWFCHRIHAPTTRFHEWLGLYDGVKNRNLYIFRQSVYESMKKDCSDHGPCKEYVKISDHIFQKKKK